jgi:hypothetical protein
VVTRLLSSAADAAKPDADHVAAEMWNDFIANASPTRPAGAQTLCGIDVFLARR